MAHASTKDAAQVGRRLVMAEVLRRGAKDTKEEKDGRRTIVLVGIAPTQVVKLIVKSRRRGTWHASVRDGAPTAVRKHETTFWVLVDLSFGPNDPSYFVVPDWWMINSIFEVHEAFLASHGGERPRTPGSDHHGIALDRIERWHNRWDLLGLS